MVTIAQRTKLDRVISLPDCTITVIENILSPGGACDWLPVPMERPAKICPVEVTHNCDKTIWVLAFHTHYLLGQCVYHCGDVSRGWKVNTRE